MDWVSFLILALATWRISSLFVSEPGPFKVFQGIREVVGIQHDEQGEILIIPERFLPQLLSCVWCFSVWVAFGLAIIFYLFPVSVWLTLPFALSALAIFLQENLT